MPDWQTSRLLAGTLFARKSDLSLKRNLALMLSHLLGWSRIVFLDDDIIEINAQDVAKAGGLLDTYNAVGLHVGGFPDNSVGCHAFRQAGGPTMLFGGGGGVDAPAAAAASADSERPWWESDPRFTERFGRG